MNPEIWTKGTQVSLPDLLDHRENRVKKQREILSQALSLCSGSSFSLISFTMNVPGPVKVFPLVSLAYETGKKLIQDSILLLEGQILSCRETQAAAGLEAFFLVNLPARQIKERLCALEEEHPLGRLFDFDVLDQKGEKISRLELGFSERTCLLCQRPAFLCGRSRTHSAKELMDREIQIMDGFFQERMAVHLGLLMQKALFYEVNTTLKPGLVDRVHTGSHQDMDLSSFVKSGYALTPYFITCAREGLGFSRSPARLPLLFSRLRPLGREAELLMKKASGGANTHKGLIFSGGILASLSGYIFSYFSETGDSVRFLPLLGELCREMLPSLLEDYEELNFRLPKTHGERLYQKYRITGIRGEARAGFPLVLEKGLPLFEELLKRGYSLNQSSLLVLLFYISAVEDSNLFIRAGYEKAKKIQEALFAFRETASYDQQLSILPELDRYFVSQNISPGGSADLLALTCFLHFLRCRPCCFT